MKNGPKVNANFVHVSGMTDDETFFRGLKKYISKKIEENMCVIEINMFNILFRF